ncbi:Cysteine-rich receptor-like protein kinase [Thalictrum thalictroides]|uniref:Cysteine-rich receptor-like protein kinase n=1 Tax=Thalictrum thalictroides TaxID=46969 RepID=A0A7J6VE15_THATH|nr:Cysteine-rich receptor-like protein kinase [Thalictrum thalictroides]
MRRQLLLIPVLFFVTLCLQVGTTLGAARAQTIQIRCGTIPEHNPAVFVPNFVGVMDNISTQMRTVGYGQAINGSGPDTNYGFAQCYGDLSVPDDCTLCYAEARTILPQCFPNNSGRIYLDGCFMRAENYSFFKEYRGPDDRSLCGNTTQKDSKFRESAKQAVLNAVVKAPKDGGYARQEVIASGPGNNSVYVLANCWKTLDLDSCKACLENASTSLMGCLPWSEGRALYTGCFMRYSDQNFLNRESSGRPKVSVIVLVVAIVSSLAVVVVGTIVGIHIWKSKRLQKKRKGSNDATKMAKTLVKSSLNFKYSTLEHATGSFDIANKLGQGGFGTVYKGVLADGREVAVKRLFVNNRHRAGDFYNEVNLISSLEHKNLVRLLGCSCSGPESLLVYEYLPNKSLDRFLFDPTRGKILNWKKRLEIMYGTAEGLIYLHENPKVRIIHRDIKASNVLLDAKNRAKIADFGLARSFQDDKSHISTAIAGTLGYMAPEYLAHGQLTEKADVYSYGVLLIEMVSGRQNNMSNNCDYSDSLVTTVWKHYQSETVEEICDPNLMLNDYNDNLFKQEMLRVVHVALLCVQETSSSRPSMSRVLQSLLSKDEELPEPTHPPFIDEKTMALHDKNEDPRHPLYATTSSSVATISSSTFYPR